MLKPTLLALAITSALLTACGGGGAPLAVQPPPVVTPAPIVTPPPVVTPAPIVTPPPVTTPPVTTPPVATANSPFAFDTHEVTVKAGSSVILTTNIKVNILSNFNISTGLIVARPTVTGGGLDPIHVQLTAAVNAPTYDIYVIGSGLKTAGDYLGGDTYDWVKVHVIGSAPAPWVHPEALSAPADPVELAFLSLLNDARAKGGTCTNPATGIPMTWPAVPPVTLNAQASGGLRMKVEDSVLRGWLGNHVSPEGMGQSDFINMAGMSGFINEILVSGYIPSPDPAQSAALILNTFLKSYYHCNTIFASAVNGGGQVGIGFYRSPSNQAELTVSFTDNSGINMIPLLKLN
jgi:hypothetical protein